MKRDFTHENFEEFLKRSADGLRMKAPDKVWKNLSKELNKRRRRTIFGWSAFLLISTAVGYSVISNVSTSTLTETSSAASKRINTNPAQATTKSTNTDRSNSTSPVQSTPSLLNANPALATGHNRTLAPVISLQTRQVILPGEEIENPGVSEPANNDVVASTESAFTPTVVDSYTEFDEVSEPSAATASENKMEKAPLPYSIESVINSFKSRTKQRKLEVQFYFTPTISYRKLSENKSYLRNLDPNIIPADYPAFHSSVNNKVTHKPDVGFELGFTGKYVVSNKVKIRAGIQFNINRYEIKAFNSRVVNATIRLNNGGRIDSLTTTTGYSTVKENGYKTDWLKNLSFQASLPVGAEYIFADNDKVQLGFGATVQPTYVINDRAYLITTDYKNYAEADLLVRRWNVNTAFETFVNINSGKTRWQIGPQVRYQLLSSFISKYPIKENLFDFGLKVGVSLGK
jgi:hypothetical protein